MFMLALCSGVAWADEPAPADRPVAQQQDAPAPPGLMCSQHKREPAEPEPRETAPGASSDVPDCETLRRLIPRAHPLPQLTDPEQSMHELATLSAQPQPPSPAPR